MTREIKLLSKCCNAKVETTGGGYDGENIVPITDICTKCGEICKVKGFKGRPKKLPF